MRLLPLGSMYIKRWMKSWAIDQPNPPKQQTIFRYMNAKIRLLGCVCFLEALPAVCFQPSERTPTRTGDLIDVNDEAYSLKDNQCQASNFLENKYWAKRWANPSF
jgi:hypothetical protein